MPALRAALLRGVNLGPSTRVPMAELRELFEKLGYTEVRTLLNSGNVVFATPRRPRGDERVRIEKAIAGRFGVRSAVVLMTAAEVAAAVDGEPFGRAAPDPKRLLVVALREVKAKSLVRGVLAADWSPEAISAGRRVLYLWCAGGLNRSPLWTAVLKALGDAGTGRNLATMRKLRALLERA